ncbi:Hsp70 family protein [Nocardia wallacei]|uniref:Hsp70 family protein n=1 Tax=Nocardia wallacei TaxID=480035 RepID=UPI0024554681|nr:Hsp70 family protein [Nocardia wallacei]
MSEPAPNSDTIDVGIDLGTTNSAVAVAADGDAAVVKNNENVEITPSAVWIPRRDLVYVGDRARKRAESDPRNTASEFKQMMGYDGAAWHFTKAGISLTPQQLSAEILKTLRQNVARARGEAPDVAVITVPAAFALNQRNATLHAAELAGLGRDCPLIQEPTAAAFAYALHEGTGRGYWLVFDFGGGTFDAAVVDRGDDELRVLTHAGDRSLGGKDIDWALVEHVLAPAVARQFGFDDFDRGNRRFSGVFGSLKALAEQAKIDLSQHDSTDLLAELNVDGRLDGREEMLELTVRREELDALAEPFYTRAINLARTAISEAALTAGRIDRVLLVGGTTLAPGLRERLADPRHGLGIALDFSADPTTVVARGAALFAATVRRPRRAAHTARANGFALELTHEPSVTTTTAVVAGRVRGTAAGGWPDYSVTLSNPESAVPFRSARIPLNGNGAFSTMVDLDAHRTSRFRVELTDAAGTPCALEPDTFTLTHRAGPELGGVRLADSLGVQRADEGFTVLLRKGATLPATVHKQFKTSDALRRADLDSVLRIPIAEGERSRGERNRRVGMLEIRSADIHVDLPAGSDVDVTFEVDTSGMVTAVADLPGADIQTEAVIDLTALAPPTHRDLAAQLREAEQRLSLLPDHSRMPARAARVRGRIDEEDTVASAREKVDAAAADPAAAVAAEDRLRDLHAALDDITDALAVPELVRDLESTLAEISTLVDQTGDAEDRRSCAELQARADEAVRAHDPVALRRQLDRATELHIDLLRRRPEFPLLVFHALQSQLQATPAAGPLLREGGRAADRGDMRALISVNHRLRALLPADIRTSSIGIVE